MASSDSGVESNADAEILAEAHKEEQRVTEKVQSAAPESRNAAVASPSGSRFLHAIMSYVIRRKLNIGYESQL